MLGLEKAQRVFRFEEETLATLITEPRIMASDERDTVKTLNEFSEEAKRQTTKMRSIQREVEQTLSKGYGRGRSKNRGIKGKKHQKQDLT